MEALLNWLKANQIEKFAEILFDNDITSIDLLTELSEDDLKELGFSMGDRKRFAIGLKNLEINTISLFEEDEKLIASLPYVIAYPLRQTLLEKVPVKRIYLFNYTFLNYLKYLGLLAASEFFNSTIKDRSMVALFHKNLMESAFGKWNDYIRNVLIFLKQQNHTFFCAELPAYYESVETGNKSKKFKGEIEYQDANGDTQRIVQSGITSIGILINFRNRNLGHGTPPDDEKSQKLWDEYFPIFRSLLDQMSFAKDYPMYKKENGDTFLLQSSSIELVENNQPSESNIWIQNASGNTLNILPFFIVPGEVALTKDDKEQVFTYESYTGTTIKFFSPEGTEKLTSGKILDKLNLLLRDKQKEIPFTSENFTKEIFQKRIEEENKILLETLISEKKIIPGVYQHREQMEIKLREWIGARANIFFIAAEAGSGKTNLLAEIQKQYTERGYPSLLIRAGRMDKTSLKAQVAYLLNIDENEGLEKYPAIAGKQAEPTFILIDGLNEAQNAESIWQEILDWSKIIEPGSIKFVVTSRTNTKSDLHRYKTEGKNLKFIYGENKDNEKCLAAFTFWLTPLDMNEMKGAWENYLSKDKSRYKPLFSFDDIASFDRGLYNQINNPLVMRLFLEIYNGKPLSKKGGKHLHIWQDWFKNFSEEEQIFLKLLADEVWLKGENELLLDDALKNEKLKSYLTSDLVNSPYARMKNMGWVSRYVKDMNGCLGFTVEGALLYLLGVKLQQQIPTLDLAGLHATLQTGTNLQQSAIESFLCEQALNGNLDLVTELIDSGTEQMDLFIRPLIYYLKAFGVEATISKILEEPTENDWKALVKLDEEMEELQLHVLRKDFLIALMPLNPLNHKNAVLIGLEAINIFDNKEAEAYFAKIDTTLPFLIVDASILNQLGDNEYKFGNYDTALEYFEKCLNIRFKYYGDSHPDVANSYDRIGNIWNTKGEYDKALEYYEKCLNIEFKYYGDSHPNVAISFDRIGDIWNTKGEYDTALEYFEKCLNIRFKYYGESHPDVANSYDRIGDVWNTKGEYDKALEYFEKCLNIEFKYYGESHPNVAISFDRIGDIWNTKGEYDTALEYFEKCLNIRFKYYGESHPNVAISYNRIGDVWNTKGEYDKALEYFEKCLNIRFQYYGESHPNVANSYDKIGDIWNTKGEYDTALEYFEKCLNIRFKYYGESHPDVANSYDRIGNIWNTKGEYDKALEYFEKCLNIRFQYYGESHPDVANSYDRIGNIWNTKGEYDKALEYFEKCLNIEFKYYGESHPNVAISFDRIGDIWNTKGEYDTALEYFEKCLNIEFKYYGESHPNVANSYDRIGDIWNTKGEYDKSLEYYEKCLNIRFQYYGESHPNVANSYNRIGDVWNTKGEYDKALEYFEKALKIQIQYYGESHPDVATTYVVIGDVWDSKGECDKALEYYEKCLNIRFQYYGESHPYVASSYDRIGDVWDTKGEYDKALEYFEKCLNIRFQYYGESHPDVANSYDRIGDVWDTKGEYDKALEYFEKCLNIRFQYYGESHPDVANSYDRIGDVWNTKGEYDKALEYFEKCLNIRFQYYGESHPNVGVSKRNIGKAFLGLGNCKNAAEMLAASIIILAEGQVQNDPKLARAYLQLAKCHRLQKEYENAQEVIEKAIGIFETVFGAHHIDTAHAYFEKALLLNDFDKINEAQVYFKKCYEIRRTKLGNEHPDTEVAGRIIK
jgi:tetratricopeptide (TPR) repeat protein